MMAHGAAISIFEFILNDSALSDSLIGVPFYFHVMISFAGHFLLSCNQYSEQLSIDVDNNISLMDAVIELFKSLPCIAQHPLHKMTAALERKLYESKAVLNKHLSINTGIPDNSLSSSMHGVTDPLMGGMSNNGQRAVEGNGSMLPNNGMMHPENTSTIPGSSHSTLGQGNQFETNLASLPSGFSMMPADHNASIDMAFQDFGQFGFLDMQMNGMS
jgi:hypothetical protein